MTLADLYLAYKKAKIEAFRENTYIDAIGFSQYEKKLHQHLLSLHEKLNDPECPWYCDSDIVNGYTYVPKSLNCDVWNTDNELFYRAINPVDDWEYRFNTSRRRRADASFRLIITPSIDFQIISALWILKVGHLYEARIDPSVSYANKLRRISSDTVFGTIEQEVNRDSRDLFQPYFSAYKRWRDKGLSAMKSSLLDGKGILAVTMDIQRFYHHVSPMFLTNLSFLKKIGLHLDPKQKQFTKNLIAAINTWYETTPDSKVRKEGALPVGLSASKIISNVLLCEFDNSVRERVQPIYYGRYVDDIFLVLEKTDELSSGHNLLKWLSKTLGNNIKYVDKSDIGPYLQAKYSYANDCQLIFPSDKQKIFDLSPPHGLDLIEQISDQIRQQSSEYKLLSEIPSSNVDMASKALLASPDATLAADALRKADVVSVRRLGFSLLLGDIETYERDLKPQDWSEVRHEFYQLIDRYLLTPTGIFEFTRYLHRVFSLSIACGDYLFTKSFLFKLESIFELLENTSTAGSSTSHQFKLCKSFFYTSHIQAAVQASTVRGFVFSRRFTQLIKNLSLKPDVIEIKNATKKGLMSLSKDVLLADFGRRPYKDYWYYEQKEDFHKVPIPRSTSVRKLLRISSIRSFRKVSELNVPYWKALAFPTRPLTLYEIGLIAPKVLEDKALLKRSILGLRGARVTSDLDFGISSNSKYRHVSASGDNGSKVSVALTNIETTDQQWELAARLTPDRSLGRYKKIIRVINQILGEDQTVDYVVFPECSIPRRWAISIARRLSCYGISFIAGLEYYNYRKVDKLRNDSLISLATNWPGYTTGIIYLQSKLQPAHDEKQYLRELKARPLYQPKPCNPILPIYIHNNFHFGILICSDLTNISNRHYFQGDVDALFVLEWNQDTNTFSFLVESAAQDIHAFVIQVNNRVYGDSRIRAPYRDDYKRDVVRVKGGVSDYYVIGEIDYISLRKSQNERISKKSEFKPVPIGFVCSDLRK